MKVDIFLDSGAYSAGEKGVVIPIKEYIAFVQANLKYIHVYANLDVIGDPEATWKNQRIMEKAGLKPLPVYHLWEDLKYLERAMQYPYFCVGGVASRVKVSTAGVVESNRISHAEKVRGFDQVFSIVCQKKNKFLPSHKVHAFGVTSLELMLRYPWYSVDSTSWVLTSRFGSVYVPRIKEGKYIYNENSWKVCVSNRSPGAAEEGKHFNTFSPREQRVILDYFEFKGFRLGKSEVRKVEKGYKLQEGERWFGKEEADSQRGIYGDRSGYVTQGWTQDRMVETVIESGLCNDYRQRDKMNIIYFMDLEKSMPKWPWPYQAKRSSGFFL